MREEERQRRLKIIAEKEAEAQKLRKMQAKLNQLKESLVVKKYFELQKKLEGKKILSSFDLMKGEMERLSKERDCPHDIWYYAGGVRMDYLHRTWYFAKNNEGPEAYKYYCLDCGKSIIVSPEYDFRNDYCVINGGFGKRKDYSYSKCREIYAELLLTNPANEAYQKLYKRIHS